MSMDRERSSYGDEFEERESDRKLLTPAIIATGVVVAVVLIFVLQNGEKRQIDFLFVEVTTRVWVALAIAIALGVILDRLFLFWWRRRGRRRDDR